MVTIEDLIEKHKHELTWEKPWLTPVEETHSQNLDGDTYEALNDTNQMKDLSMQ